MNLISNKPNIDGLKNTKNGLNEIDWTNPVPEVLNKIRMKEGECLEITIRDIENVPVPKS